DLNLRHVPHSSERTLQAIGRRQRDDEVIDAIEASLHALTIGGRDRDGDRTPTRRLCWRSACRSAAASASAATADARDPEILQLHRLGYARRNALQIAGCGVTRRALRREVRRASLRVAHDD